MDSLFITDGVHRGEFSEHLDLQILLKKYKVKSVEGIDPEPLVIQTAKDLAIKNNLPICPGLKDEDLKEDEEMKGDS